MAVSLEKKTIISQDGRKSRRKHFSWDSNENHVGGALGPSRSSLFSNSSESKIRKYNVSPMSVALDEPCKILETSVAYLQNENRLQGAVLPLNVCDIDTMERESWCFHPWEKVANNYSWPWTLLKKTDSKTMTGIITFPKLTTSVSSADHKAYTMMTWGY